jgi:hypothetical protein
MKACLYIGHQGNEWIEELFPGKSPCEMTIAGKSWCRHAIELCCALKVDEIFIVDCFFYDELRNRIGDGSYWSLKVEWLPGADVAFPSLLLERHRGVLPDEDLLIFWGQVLPDLPDPEQLFENLRPVAEGGDALPNGIYLRNGDRLCECVCPLHRMDTLKSYFDLNFRILNDPGIYLLPGYASEPGLEFGRNVIMMPNCKISPPAVISNDCFLGRSVSLEGDVILCKEVMIESYSRLKHCIVMNYSYVGRNMSIEDKIVVGNRVIDVNTGAYVDLHDGLLVKTVKPRRLSGYSAAEYLTALTLTIVLAPAYLLGCVFKKRLEKLPFFKFLLRVYPKILLVLAGRADLVRIGVGDRYYAFRSADQWLLFDTEHKRELADVYFHQHRSVRLMLAVVINSLLKRMFILTEPRRDRRTEPED